MSFHLFLINTGYKTFILYAKQMWLNGSRILKTQNKSIIYVNIYRWRVVMESANPEGARERSTRGASRRTAEVRREQREVMKADRTASKMWTEVKNKSMTAVSEGNSSKVRSSEGGRCFFMPCTKNTSVDPGLSWFSPTLGDALFNWCTCLQAFNK